MLRFLEVVSLVGAKTYEFEPKIKATDFDLKEAKKFIGKEKVGF